MNGTLQVHSLSGGERRRLQLAAVLVEKPNLLILDEPTNDLDLQTVEVVEELLSEYKGCLLVVSHDRTFMENLADRLFVVTGDGLVRMFDGLYSEVRPIRVNPPPPGSALNQSLIITCLLPWAVTMANFPAMHSLHFLATAHLLPLH